jgi:hypothetical protein
MLIGMPQKAPIEMTIGLNKAMPKIVEKLKTELGKND